MEREEYPLNIGYHARIVSAGIAVSRIFGFLRDALIAFFLTNGLRDIFFLIFTIPNFLRHFFGEGALSSAFIPIFSQQYKKKGKEDAWRMASSTVNIIFILLIFLTVVGIIMSPFIITVIAPGFTPALREIATVNLRIMFPFLIFICLQAVFMGMLNSMGHFFISSFAPVLFNLSIICLILLFPHRLGGLLPLSIGVVIGGFLQMAIQIPLLLKRGYRPSFYIDWRSPVIKGMFQLMGPVLLGVGVIQINILIDKILASFLPPGGISALYYSNRLIQLPLALFGISIIQATFPLLASQAVKEENERIKETVLSSLKLLGFTIIPATFTLIFFGKPLINLLFERGEFTSVSTELTHFALIFYATGLFAFAGKKILLSTFYSLKDMVTPMKIGMASVGINIALNLLLIRPMREGGLALATSVASFFNLILLLYYLERHLGKINTFNILLSLGRMIMASCMMGIVFWMGSHFFYAIELNIIQKILVATLILSLGGAVYLIFCYLFGIPEVRFLKNILLWTSKRK